MFLNLLLCKWVHDLLEVILPTETRFITQRTNSKKGYFHSTMSIHSFLIGFLTERQKSALSGLSTTFGGLRTTRFRSCFSLSMALVAPRAACQALDKGFSSWGGPSSSPPSSCCLDGVTFWSSRSPVPPSWMAGSLLGAEEEKNNY